MSQTAHPSSVEAVINGKKCRRWKKNANDSAQRLLTNWRHHFSNYIITIFWKC